MNRLTSIAGVALGIWVGAHGLAHAQQGTGELRGKVLDAQNAVLPGVTVVAKNEASPYVGGVTHSWLKVKVPGWTDPNDRWKRVGTA